ncbi:unnamed protein product [Paramecium sonneborni]|uniref:Transmembrane protein n=1 Tax=Paramecium sonneborni TaxID=65129 RepID=A0A8S1K7L1_9CILI|nr:unnamed protein product [Paramecium sonneborni]
MKQKKNNKFALLITFLKMMFLKQEQVQIHQIIVQKQLRLTLNQLIVYMKEKDLGNIIININQLLLLLILDAVQQILRMVLSFLILHIKLDQSWLIWVKQQKFQIQIRWEKSSKNQILLWMISKERDLSQLKNMIICLNYKAQFLKSKLLLVFYVQVYL